ncbi:hypothetical protein K227x_61810 [Rubripirellula lacrimiformis]|uniref:Ice-binding protein C-terminal domain-containing protein n=1 Tax=Rubripirellula lacrimiformis TaxID=1930273 RepID=A0A517NL27_9BACT|nr:PEP-CTERM sorting domain-containing protein [Rubripirellula lacrimiformis]QDT07753.1 hypothetical protein K227x_61810 [Rubripirellula lacrimiformis]
MIKKFLPALVLTLAAGPASAAIVVSDNFDGYADTAAMQVNWGASGAGSLDTTTGNGGQSAAHPGGTVNSWIGSSFALTPTATQAIVLTADLYDDATSQNERLSVGLRNGANPLFEMGHYNGADGHYFVRILNTSGNEGWVPIDDTLNDGGIVAGWNRYEATFTLTDLTVTIDLGADGTIDGTFVSTGAPSANAFTDLRFGGPSNLSSGGGGFNVDNISLTTVAVPEPTSMAALAALGVFGVARRRMKTKAKASV